MASVDTIRFYHRGGAASGTVMSVHIQSYESRVPEGVFVEPVYRQIYAFRGFDQMLLMMDDMMDTMSAPKTALERRSLTGKPYRFWGDLRQDMPERCGRECMTALPGGKASFSVAFYYREHGSMQGEVTAKGSNGMIKIRFRSALELIRLLYEHLDEEIGK